jgi:hypothetical protein
MCPVAESILPQPALSRQSRGPVTSHATGAAYTSYATRSTRSTYSVRPTDAADTTYSSRPSRAAHTTYSAYSAYSSRPAHTTGAAYAADTAYSSGPANTTDTADTAYSSRPAHTADTAHTTDAAGNAIPVEAVVVVDINTAAAPAATPPITAAPPRAHQDSRAKGERGAGRVVTGRIGDGWIWIGRFTVYSCRLICRHVDNFRIGRFHHHHALVFDYSGFHRLLLGGVQSTFVLCLPAHALNGVHQIALLRQESIAKISGPLQVVSQ